MGGMDSARGRKGLAWTGRQRREAIEATIERGGSGKRDDEPVARQQRHGRERVRSEPCPARPARDPPQPWPAPGSRAEGHGLGLNRPREGPGTVRTSRRGARRAVSRCKNSDWKLRRRTRLDKARQQHLPHGRDQSSLLFATRPELWKDRRERQRLEGRRARPRRRNATACRRKPWGKEGMPLSGVLTNGSPWHWRDYVDS